MSTPKNFIRNVLFLSTTETTNSSTGSVVIFGGLAVNKNTNISGNLTVGNILSTGLTTGSVLSTGLTTGNINFTGTLYQNSTPYIGSQWTGTSGNILYYGSGGNTLVGINTTNPTSTLTVAGDLNVSGIVTIGNTFLNNFSTGTLNTNAFNMNSSSYVYSGTSTVGNNIVTPTNVLGLVLPTATTRSFKVVISVNTLVSSGPNYFAQYTVEGIQNDSGWTLDDYYIGDILNLTFSITAGGQIQYTSTNVANWTSTTLFYQATGMYLTNNSVPPNISTTGNFNILGQFSVTNTVDTTSTSTGIVVISGGVGIAKNLTVGAGATFGGALIPSVTLTQDLGSATNRWRDIFLSGNTIDLGGTLISATAGTIAFGSTVLTTTTTGNLGSSIPNLLSTNISTSTINVTGITTVSLLATSQISTNNLFSVNTSLGNLVSATGTFANKVGTNQTVGTLNVTIGITTNSLLNTIGTITNLLSTNISTSTINVTGITTVSLLATSQISTSSINATNGTISNFAVTNNLLVGGSLIAVNVTTLNVINNNISTGSLSASVGITSAALLVTGLISASNLFSATSTIPNTTSTNISTGTINTSTGITTSALLVAGLISASNLFSATSTIPNTTSTNISTGTVNVSTGITTSALLVTGLISASNLFSATSTIPNIIHTNISTGIINASTGITSAALLVTGLISAANLFSSMSTIPNIIHTNISTGTINVSTGITSAALLVTGSTRIINTTAFSTGTLTVAGPGNSAYLPATTTIGQLISVYGPGGAGVISNIDLSTTQAQSATNFLPSVRISIADLGAANSSLNILTKTPGLSVGTMASRIFIDGSGQVGINDTSPAYTLDINGSFAAQSNINGPPNSFFVGNSHSGGSAYGIIQIYNNTVNRLSMFLNSTTRTGDGGISTATIRNDGGPLRLQSSAAGSTGVYLSTSGNIGISTTSPTATLDVNGNVSITGTTTLGGNSSIKIFIMTGTHGNQNVAVSQSLPSGCTSSNIISVTGVTFNTNGDSIPFTDTGSWPVSYYVTGTVLIITPVGSITANRTWRAVLITF